MLYILPLEPMEERYTEQWYRWFTKYCTENNIEFIYVDGEQIDSSVEVGTVLDAAGTNIWKFTQLTRCMQLFKDRKVENRDIFFTMDLWHPGLEAIKYAATLYNLDIKIYGFLHAGSYTTEDFAEPMSPWAKHFERGWAEMVDGIFVGTHYHKDKFVRLRYPNPEKIHVTGNPLCVSEIHNLVGKLPPKENIIIYPNRFDQEKRPGCFIDLMNILWEKRQDFVVVFSTSRKSFKSNDPGLLQKLYTESKFPYTIKANLTKQEYYTLMARAKIYVSTTIEENFGYCLVESLALNTYPIVVDNYSHLEILKWNENHLFSCTSEFIKLVHRVLDSEEKFIGVDMVKTYEKSIQKMFDIMENSNDC